MFNKINIFFFAVCLSLLVAIGTAAVPSPESGRPTKVPSAQGPLSTKPIPPKEKEGLDLIFILDCSGSMKKTDPQDLRKPATELFASLLGSRDRIGLVSFGGLAQTIMPLTENVPANQKFFSQAVQKQINSEALYTNLLEAVRKGYEEIKSSPRATKILLLMSDGQMDLGAKEKDAEASKELFALLPQLVETNIKLYTVAFTDLSDQKLLADLAEKTKGFFQMAKTDKDLHIIFSSIFEQIKLPDTVPLEGDTFLVDKDIQEITILVTKQPGTSTRLLSPNHRELAYGKVPESVNWFQTTVFDLITMKNPLPGRWKFQLSTKEGNKVFVVTDLALKTSFNLNQVPEGQETSIEAWLEKEGNKIGESRFLESMFFMAEIKGPQGAVSRVNLYPRRGDDKGDKKGVFSTTFAFKNPGNYSLRIIVDGRTFKRELIRQVKAVSQPAAAPPPLGQILPPAHPQAEGVWARAIKSFLLINGGLLLLAGLVILSIKWKARQRGKEKNNKDQKKPPKEKKVKKKKGAS